MQFIQKSIGVKVIFLSSVLTIIAFTGLFVYNSWWEKESMLEEVHHTAERTADMLQMAIEEPMGQGDNDGTTSKFDALSNRYDDILVHLLDYKGEITYSTSKESLRQDYFKLCPQEECKEIVAASLKKPLDHGKLIHFESGPRFVQVITIKNEPKCHHCHGKSKEILGTMVMNQDVGRQFGTLQANQIKAAGISLLGVGALLTALMILIRTSVVTKIRSIVRATEEVGQGNLDADFEVEGVDELANLGDHLGNMVRRIKDQLQYNKSILDGIIVPLFVADKNECLDFANDPLKQILGDVESQGRPVSEVLPEGEGGQGSTANVIASGESRSGNMKYTRADGVEFPLHYEISPLQDAQGNVVGAIGVMIDLTTETQNRRNIEQQRRNLLEVANEVTEVANNLNNASDLLTRQMNELTSAVDTTSDQTGQAATAMEEMNATVLEVSKNASETASASDKANKVAKEGGVVVQNTVTEINHVASTTESLATSLTELSQRAENIGQVMAVINDIADQTNLLALNAAIEAARAGEAGRGFAVVADEVRKLAEKTMQATKEVEGAVSLIQQSTESVVTEMDDARERVVKTSDMAGEAGQVLGEVVTQSDVIADMVRGIATAAEQQSSTSDEISNNVTQINNLSQEISKGIQKANKDIQDISDTAQNLADLVEKFKN